MTDELEERVRSLNTERARNVPELEVLSTDVAVTFHNLLTALHKLFTTPPDERESV